MPFDFREIPTYLRTEEMLGRFWEESRMLSAWVVRMQIAQ
jgi:hypothetical protein